MVIKSPSSKIVDLRKAPKDIIDSFKKSAELGVKIKAVSVVPKKLVGLLRINILKK